MICKVNKNDFYYFSKDFLPEMKIFSETITFPIFSSKGITELNSGTTFLSLKCTLIIFS